MDRAWTRSGPAQGRGAALPQKASDYLRSGQLFFAAEGDEKSVPEVIRRLVTDIIF